MQSRAEQPSLVHSVQPAPNPPLTMVSLQDVQAQNFSPQAMAKYANDKDLMELLEEFKRIM